MILVAARALAALQAGDPPNVPAWLDGAPSDVGNEIAKAIMEGRWAQVEAVEDAMRVLVQRLHLSRIDAELAEAQRQHREAIASGDEDQTRALAVREMELIKMKLRLRR